MKPFILALCAILLAGCASAPRGRVDARGVAQRLGMPANVAYTLHGCSYAQALPDDEDADFVTGATCVLYPDRLAILRSRSRGERPAYFRFKALEGVAVAKSGWRSQLQMLGAGTVLVVEMDANAASAAAQEHAFSTARREGVPVFQADFVEPRSPRSIFVPPAF